MYVLFAGGNSSPQASIFLLGYMQTAKTEQAPRFSWLLLPAETPISSLSYMQPAEPTEPAFF